MKKHYLFQNSDSSFRVVSSNSTLPPEGALVELPQSISESDHKYVSGSFDGSVWTAFVDSAKQTEVNKKESKSNLYDGYFSDVDTEMITEFGTNNTVNLLFKYLTWTMMKQDPGFYSTKGLEDESGNALDTNTKVYDYANQNIIKAMDYSVFVFNKEKELRDNIIGLG